MSIASTCSYPFLAAIHFYSPFVYTKSEDVTSTAMQQQPEVNEPAAENLSRDNKPNTENTFQPIKSEDDSGAISSDVALAPTQPIVTQARDVTLVAAQPVVTHAPVPKCHSPSAVENVKSLEEEFFDVPEQFASADTEVGTSADTEVLTSAGPEVAAAETEVLGCVILFPLSIT